MTINVGHELLTTCVDALVEVSIGKLTDEEIEDIVVEMVRAFELQEIDVREGDDDFVDAALKKIHPDWYEDSDENDDPEELHF